MPIARRKFEILNPAEFFKSGEAGRSDYMYIYSARKSIRESTEFPDRMASVIFLGEG